MTSSSITARAAIREAEVDPSPDNVQAVSAAYQGRFALDFAYEEWASPYRDSLHASYLEIIEKAVTADTNAGAFDRAINLARRAIDVDPDAEQIELSLLEAVPADWVLTRRRPSSTPHYAADAEGRSRQSIPRPWICYRRTRLAGWSRLRG